MKHSRQSLVALPVVLLAALLCFAGAIHPRRTPVSAAARDQSRADVRPAAKRSGPTHVTGDIPADAPANDNCANAAAVTSCPFDDTKDTGGATTEPGEPPSCSVIGATVWYAYTNTLGKPVILTVSLCGSNFDTVLAVYKANGGPCDFANFTDVACSDDAFNCGGGLQSAATFAAAPGATYKIQAGGFTGQTGTLAIHIECQETLCDAAAVNGALGSGDPAFTGKQSSGLQLGRLTRDGVSSTCAVPKACNIIDPEGLRAFDAYEFPNDSSRDACVSVNLKVTDQTGCNLQANAYLDTYDPNDICAGHLGDPGLSSGSNPPGATNFTVVVPAGHTLIVVVQTSNFGESGCRYALTVAGNLCFDTCAQDDANPSRFILFSPINGDYEYHDCGKGVVLRGRGVVALPSPPANCKFVLDDSGPLPKRPDRSVHLEVNVCTRLASASVRFPLTAKAPSLLSDSD
ncbi:MAG TPA: hypothetical protein VJZ91_13390, partial [Blastocatellia bacterium]|nr:hypothetical protein [Blastocatellia bacterium]